MPYQRFPVAAFLEDSSTNLIDVASSLAAKQCSFHDPPYARETVRRLVPATVTLYSQVEGDLARRLSNAYDTLAVQGLTDVYFVSADIATLPLRLCCARLRDTRQARAPSSARLRTVATI